MSRAAHQKCPLRLLPLDCAVARARMPVPVVRPKMHGYAGYKRTGFVKPGGVKLAMGHLLHGEASPSNCAL